jgi:hypothetical protein
VKRDAGVLAELRRVRIKHGLRCYIPLTVSEKFISIEGVKIKKDLVRSLNNFINRLIGMRYYQARVWIFSSNRRFWRGRK